MALLHPDLLGGRMHWLLDLHWGGDVLSLAERGLVCAGLGDDGEDLVYHGGLRFTGNVPDRIDLFSKTPSNHNIALQMQVGGHVDVAAKLEAGHSLAAARGRLWRWAEGTTERVLVADGRLDEVDYGQDLALDLVEASLKEAPWQDRSKLPARTLKVDKTTWPNAPDSVLEEFYPLVIGKPGAHGSKVYATPAILVDTTGAGVVLISGLPVVGGTVWLFNRTTGAEDSYTVQHRLDGLDQRVAWIDPGAGTVAVADGDDIWVAWDASDGGIYGFGDELLRGAGDVLGWFLAQSTLRWDQGRILAAAAELNRFKVDCYFQPAPGRPMSCWDWLTEYLLPMLPVSARFGPEGLYFAVWRYDVPPTATSITYTLGVNARRESSVSYVGLDEVANEIRIQYAPRHDDKPSAELVVTGNRRTLQVEKDIAEPDQLCEASVLQFDTRVMDFRSDVIYDPATARAVASWKAAAHALPPRRLQILVKPEHAREPGSAVGLVAPELGISTSRTALVEDLVPRDGWVELGLLVLERPNQLFAA